MNNDVKIFKKRVGPFLSQRACFGENRDGVLMVVAVLGGKKMLYFLSSTVWSGTSRDRTYDTKSTATSTIVVHIFQASYPLER